MLSMLSLLGEAKDLTVPEQRSLQDNETLKDTVFDCVFCSTITNMTREVRRIP